MGTTATPRTICDERVRVDTTVLSPPRTMTQGGQRATKRKTSHKQEDQGTGHAQPPLPGQFQLYLFSI